MWGTLDLSGLPYYVGRFIPTHVGNTIQLLDYCRFSAVHPHACGEHQEYLDGELVPGGSSPRMWGTLLAEA